MKFEYPSLSRASRVVGGPFIASSLHTDPARTCSPIKCTFLLITPGTFRQRHISRIDSIMPDPFAKKVPEFLKHKWDRVFDVFFG